MDNPHRDVLFKAPIVCKSELNSPEFLEYQSLKRQKRKNLKRKVRNIIYSGIPKEWSHKKKLIVSGKAALLSINSSLKYMFDVRGKVQDREYQKELHIRLTKMLDATELLIDNFHEMPAILFKMFDIAKDATGLKVEDYYYTLEQMNEILKYCQSIQKPTLKKLPQGNTVKMKGIHDLNVGKFLHTRNLERLNIAQILVSIRASLTADEINLAYEEFETIIDVDRELNATYQRLRNAGL